MSIWNPQTVLTEQGLRLTADEKAYIKAKLPPEVSGNVYADAVFEGGGVKGTAFLGALRCFDDVNVKWRKVAGTSAGAITAAMVAADFTIDQLEAIVGELDYVNDILKQKSSPLIFNGSPEDDLCDPKWMIGNLILTGKTGQYSSEPFKHWLHEKLKSRLTTFAPFLNGLQSTPNWYDKRQLKIIVSDISKGEMRVLPDDLPTYSLEQKKQFSVAEAVRLSMSIPFFFEPGELEGCTIVDGGILSNFPLWIYDIDQPSEQLSTEKTRPNCPTFGFQLTSKREEPRKLEGATEILSGMVDTMMVAHDRRYQQKNKQGRVIGIDTFKVSVTKFNLTNADKDYLYYQGYKSAKDFLLNEWDWQKHLQSRGFSVA